MYYYSSLYYTFSHDSCSNLYLISSHLNFSHLLSSPLISSPLISSPLISSPLLSSLISPMPRLSNSRPNSSS
ncbi:hypothetical protein CAAN1_09S04764 [[Candida] anglica]|uniref:Uncharacterized protein n=1 Tax=[Candida] anglica TaxID=148631 RepID=A0ABP0EF75_9ASCO